VLQHPYIADFIVYDSIVLEVKSVSAIIDSHITQTINYLRVSDMKLGII
ncbi:MAG: GxxExxY protein, partial [Bacteroidota bacterium]|nr:GxxExxY protein [Bacteroidota bacterium]